MPIRLIVDTDISLGTPNAEIDDGAALLLLANSPQVEVKAITTVHGNAPVEIVSTNLLRFRNYLNLPGVQIAQGAAEPLLADPSWAKFLNDWQSQYGPIPAFPGQVSPLDAVDLIIETVLKFPGEIIILALGPLTNLALVLMKEPAVARMVKAVYAMGGSLNDTDQSEFNIRCDPEAAQTVFQAEWPVKLHGLELTRQILFTPEDFASLDIHKPAQALLQAQAKEWVIIVEEQGWEQGGCSLHDAVAATAVIAPGIFEYTSAQIEVDTNFGLRRGITSAKPNTSGKTKIATKVATNSCRELILEKIKE